MAPTPPTTIRFSAAEREILDRLGAELGLSISDVLRRGLAILAKQGEEEAQREQEANAKAAELIKRVRAAGIEFGEQAVIVERHVSERIAVRVGPHLFQEVDGKLLVSRKREDGEVEIAYLDPEPDEPDALKFARERVLT